MPMIVWPERHDTVTGISAMVMMMMMIMMMMVVVVVVVFVGLSTGPGRWWL
jgi:hypothetical protein